MSRKNADTMGREKPAVHYSNRKAPVMVLVERNGRARSTALTGVTAHNLKDVIRRGFHWSSRILTHEYVPYGGIGAEYEGGHETVDHTSMSTPGGDVHTNTAESYFAIMKRGIYGTLHHGSRRHLHRYMAEFDFRWNTPHVDDGARAAQAIRGTEGRRLMYRDQTGR